MELVRVRTRNRRKSLDEALRGLKVTATASSTLNDNVRYKAANLVDRDYSTAWCAGSGKGVGEWIELDLSKPMKLVGVAILNGYFKSTKPDAISNWVQAATDKSAPTVPKPEWNQDWVPDLWSANRRVSAIEVSVNGKVLGTEHLDDKALISPLGDVESSVVESVLDFYIANQVVFSNLSKSSVTDSAKKIRLTIRADYAGTKFNDTCISEIQLMHPSKPEKSTMEY